MQETSFSWPARRAIPSISAGRWSPQTNRSRSSRVRRAKKSPKGRRRVTISNSPVFPAETLGKRYFVTRPTGPAGIPVGHVVRLYGNVDATGLTYVPAAPAGCPSSLSAGQVADCGVVTSDFEVTGDHEFLVGSFMQGGSIVDPGGG